MPDTKPVGYCIEPNLYAKLREAANTLDTPYILTHEQHLMVRHQLQMILLGAMPITQADLQAIASAMP